MIAVTGASGVVGGRVARRPAARGLPLRLVVRDAARAPELGAETLYLARALADVLREHPETLAHLRA